MKYYLILIFLYFFSNQSLAQSNRTLFEVASEKVKAENYNGAIADLNTFIKSNPKHLPSRILRAKCYSFENKFQLALEDNLIILDLDKDANTEAKTRYLRDIGFDYSMIDEYAKSREFYQKANTLKGNDIYILSNIGYTFRKDKLYDSAIVYFDKALLLGKTHIFSIRNKIQCLKALDKIDEAFNLSNEFLISKNYDIDISLFRASILKDRGKTTEALNDYHRALTYEPEDYDALIGVSECYIALGYYEEDLKLKQRMVKVFKANKESNTMLSNANYLLASAYKFLGDYQSAIETFDEAEALNPKDAGILLERALAKALSKDLEGACNDLKKARAIDEEKANEYEEFIIEDSEFEEFANYCFPN